MREVLIYLKQLQKVDLEMLEVVKVRDTFPARVRELEQLLAGHQRQLASKQQSFEKIHQDRLEKHQKFKEDDDRLKKWERRLNDSKNAREASSLAREIDAHKRLNTELEEEVLKLLEQEDQEKKILEGIASTIHEVETTLVQERAVCEEKLGELNIKISAFETARRQYTEHLPHSLLSRYEAVKKARGGLAVVPARNGCCTGCNMRLRPQLYNTILKFESLETCPSCKRLLFCDDEGTTEATQDMNTKLSSQK